MSSSRLAPFLAIFFASGFAALVYQTVWQRLLAFFGGADLRSVTIIVSAYMAGLGCGSLAGGHLADRLGVRGRFLLFAAAELAVAGFGFVSVWLYYDFLAVRLGPAGLSPLLTAAVIFLTLLWPTFFMGMSLPLLARALTGSAARAGQRIGTLYGWNTFGAAVGSLVAVWVLARSSGFRATVEWGAFLNLACAAAALLIGPRYWRGGGEDRDAASPPAESPASPPAAGSRFGLGAWLAVYALSGFIALSLEILWFRLLGVLLRSNAFTFATLLALYLTGVGLGALLGGRRARAVRRPDLAFLALQSAVTLYAALSLGALIHGLGRWRLLERVWTHLGGHDPFPVDVALRALQRVIASGGQVAPHAWDAATQLVVLYVLVPGALILPPTLLMGMSFAFLQQAAQVDLRSLGRRVGWLQAANIAGSTLGAVLTGVALLHWLGSAWTLRLLVMLGGVFLALWSRARGRGWMAAAAPALVVTGAVAWLSPSPDALWSKLHGSGPGQIVFGEDGSGLSVMKDEAGPERRTTVIAHGLSQGELPYGGYHVELGALPVILHPSPAEVLVIGLGSGTTAFATGGRAETVRIDCVEIVASQLPALFTLAQRHRYEGLAALLRDGRVRHISGDGRALVMRGGRWDVIEADALRPQSSYAGNLYSLEYFTLLGRHLKPGGLAVSWSPTPRTRDTFLQAFPHVAVFGHTLVGSNEPIAFDREVLRARLHHPFTSAYYRRAGVDILDLLGPVLERGPAAYGPGHDRSALVDLNTDLFPRDEYLASGRQRPRTPPR